MSNSNYKTRINGVDVSFDELFSQNGSQVGLDILNRYSGVNIRKAGDSNSSISMHGVNRYLYGATGTITSAVELDQQRNIRYKSSGTDIGPSCCAKFVDKTASTSRWSIPAWVDYYIVIAIGEGGKLGYGRDTNDQHWRPPTGGTGGIITWKSPDGLGGNSYTAQVIIGESGWFGIYNSGGNLHAYCAGGKGGRGGWVHGDDGNDTHTGNANIGGGAGGGTDVSGGTVINTNQIAGISAMIHVNGGNSAPNPTPTLLQITSSPGRGSHWTGGDKSVWGSNNGNGSAFVRYYPIAYDHA